MTTQATEIARTQFIGTSSGHFDDHDKWIVGPVLVDVVIYTHGPGVRDTYSLVIDGQPQLGGYADEIGVDGLPQCAFLTLRAASSAYLDGWNDHMSFVAGQETRSAGDLGRETPEYREDYGKGWAAARAATARTSIIVEPTVTAVPSPLELPAGEDTVTDEPDDKLPFTANDYFPLTRQATHDLLTVLEEALKFGQFTEAQTDRCNDLFGQLLSHQARLISHGDPEPLP